MRYCLGIEIGGTKLQIGMGDGARAEFAAFRRDEVDANQGAAEIRRRIVSGCRQLLDDNRVSPEQIAGAMEIGHLRPGRLPRSLPHGGNTVEAIASGFGITERARREITDWRDTLAYVRSQFAGKSPHETELAPAFQERLDPRAERFSRLLEFAGGDPARITTKLIAQAAHAGDKLSLELLADATWAIGWALAQAIALVNPARIVIGGGVSLIGEELFFEPVRRACRQQCFEPFSGIAEIVPAALGEEVVVYGALAVAAQAYLQNA
jgi:glucokinase